MDDDNGKKKQGETRRVEREVDKVKKEKKRHKRKQCGELMPSSLDRFDSPPSFRRNPRCQFISITSHHNGTQEIHPATGASKPTINGRPCSACSRYAIRPYYSNTPSEQPDRMNRPRHKTLCSSKKIHKHSFTQLSIAKGLLRSPWLSFLPSFDLHGGLEWIDLCCLGVEGPQKGLEKKLTLFN